jgi:drug/metabolite transporter, DME family
MEGSAGTAPAGDAAGQTDPLYVRGVVLVLLAGSFWSLGGLFVRLIESADAWQIILYRSLALVAALLLLIAIGSEGRIVRAFARAGWNGLAAGAFLAAGFIGFVLALHLTTVANATFMLGACPFLAALIGRWLLGEAVRPATWISMAMAAAGVALMVGNGVALGTGLGSLVALGTAVGFAFFSVLLRRGRESDMLPCVCHAGMVSAATAGLVVALGLAGSAGFALSPQDLGLCLLMGVVQLAAGLTCYTVGARHLPAAELLLLSMIELALAPIWVWIAVDEVPSGLTLAGGAVIMAAIAFQALSGARRRRLAIGPV